MSRDPESDVAGSEGHGKEEKLLDQVRRVTRVRR